MHTSGIREKAFNDSNSGPAQRGYCVAHKVVFLGWLNVLENIETIKCPERARRRPLEQVVAEERDRISIAGRRLRGLNEFRIEIDCRSRPTACATTRAPKPSPQPIS